MISYKSLYGLGTEPGISKGDIMKFKTVDRKGFNVTDNIDTRFFKILFYFFNEEEGEKYRQVDWYNGGSTGLLAPTWLDNPNEDYYKYNSAWAYLKNNLEDERADVLERFVNLLSQISSESPWYFKQIDGIDDALTRENFVVPEERKKITITCMNDPVDHRISSLLSMYRSIVWSHTRKCEVLPTNLRKFDMGLFVFSGLLNGLHVKHNKLTGTNSWYNIDDKDYNNASNYKYIEFINCEIALDSIKSGFSGLNNESGFEQEFKIDIYFDDCYENEYNPFIIKTFGDFFIEDSFSILDHDNAGNVITPPDMDVDTEIDDIFAQDTDEMLTNDLNQDWHVTKTVEDRLYPFGNVKEQNQSLPTKVRTNMNDLTIPTSKDALKQKIKSEYNNIQNKIGNKINYLKNINASTVLNKLVKEAEKTIERAINSDLGNFYAGEMGLGNFMTGTKQELRKQMSSLQGKITGNINAAANKIVQPAAEAITKPVKKAIETTGSFATKIADTITDPLGTANTISRTSPATLQSLGSTSKSYSDNSNPNSMVAKSLGSTTIERSEPGAPQKLSDAGKSYVDKEGTYNSNSPDNLGNYAGETDNIYNTSSDMGNYAGESNEPENELEEIGNYYYSGSEQSGNNIGKNRLDTNLGNMYQTNSMINNL